MFHRVLDSPAELVCPPPGTWLLDDVEVSLYIEDIDIGGAIVLPRKTNGRHAGPDVKIGEAQFGQPFGQVRIEKQRMQRRVRVNSEQGFHDGKNSCGGPGLRPVCRGVEAGKGMGLVGADGH